MTKSLTQHSDTCFEHREDNFVFFSKDKEGNILHRDSPDPSNDWGSWASINGDLDTIEWYFDGLLHRSADNPAVMCGTNEEYYWFGKRHRLTGPAKIKRPRILDPSRLEFIHLYCNSEGEESYYDEEYEFWEDDLLHRLDGPAKFSNFYSDQEWWYKGMRIDCSSQKDFVRCLKLKHFI